MSVPAKKAKWLAPEKSAPSSITKQTEETGKVKWVFATFVWIFLLLMAFLNWFWSLEPGSFDVVEKARTRANVDDSNQLVPGYIYTHTLAEIGNTLLNKNGGYISNDVVLPSIAMDNIQNWEFGALVMLRDASTALRNHFARSQSQSKENVDLSKAEPFFYFNNDSWILPPTEGQYQNGIDYLYRFTDDLQNQSDSTARFYARADNLHQYLQVVEKRLGSFGNRLSASSIQQHQFAHEMLARDFIPSTPWLEVDDVFYEARGAAWALLHIFRAIEVEFATVLRNKAATATIRIIITQLEDTQGSVLSPMVLNGDGFGILSNYSLTIANHITAANAATLDLRDLMIRG